MKTVKALALKVWLWVVAQWSANPWRLVAVVEGCVIGILLKVLL